MGRLVGNTGRTLDPYGFQLTCAMLPGDGYRTCHDDWLKHVLTDLRNMDEWEVMGLFRGLLPPVAARMFDSIPWRTRRGMVPDARLWLRDAEEAVQVLLAELKWIHVGPTRYPAEHLGQDGRCLAVAERCCAIQLEYVDKAQRLDLEGPRPPRRPAGGAAGASRAAAAGLRGGEADGGRRLRRVHCLRARARWKGCHRRGAQALEDAPLHCP